MTWKRLTKRIPGGYRKCDFLYAGTEEEPYVWMICGVTRFAIETYDGKPLWWRDAAVLPEDVKEFEYDDE
jgi:hypothetical protein